MAIDFIDNQPIRFDSSKFDDQGCINKDTSAYAVLMQPGDPLHWQGELNCCADSVACDPNILGAERVSNGNFSSAVNWGGSGGWSINTGTGQATLTPAGTDNSLSQTGLAITVGRPYQVQVDIVSNDTGFELTVYLGGARWVVIPANFTGLYTGYATAGTTGAVILKTNNDYAYPSAGTLVITTVSVKELAICYTFDTSTREYVANGGFTGSASGWTVGAGWTWNAGNFMRHSTPAMTNSVCQIATGMRHQADILWSVTVSNRTAAAIQYYFGVTLMQFFAGNGIFSFNYPANGLSNFNLCLKPTASFDGDIDDISATETTSGWVYNPLNGFIHWQGWSTAFYAGNTLDIGTYYKLTVEVICDEGSVTLEAGGNTFKSITKTNTYDFYFTALTAAGEKIIPSADFDGSVKIIGLCELISQVETRLVYQDGSTGATDWHSQTSPSNPVVLDEGFITWRVNSLAAILSGGVPVALTYSCFKMQVRYNCISTGRLDTYTSDNLISYQASHPCTKLFMSYCNGDALGFRFGYYGNMFRLYMRLEMLYFNPSQSFDVTDYEFSSGWQKRIYASRKKKYEALFNYMDEYGHDVAGVMMATDFMYIDNVQYLADAKDYQPDWSERGKRNLAQSTMEFQKSEGMIFNRNCS